MSWLPDLRLIRFFSFYLALFFCVSTYLRTRQYRAILGLVRTMPGHRPADQLRPVVDGVADRPAHRLRPVPVGDLRPGAVATPPAARDAVALWCRFETGTTRG